MQDLFGGSKSKNVSTSGFGLLPPEIQQAFTNLATQGQNTLAPQGGSPNSAIFTLPSLAPSSQSALSQIENQNFAITPESIQAGINEQMNPYDQSVIDTINREAAGKGSVLNQEATAAGQFGSNRQALGANDIDLSRLQQIGAFKQNEFQNASNNALTTIPQTNAGMAAGSVNAGLTQQQQQLQNQQAPVSALAALSQIFGILPTSGGSTGESSSRSNNGIFKSIGL